MQILIGEQSAKMRVCQRHELRLVPRQVLLLEMAFHDFQGFHVFLTGRDHAVGLVIIYAVHVMATGGKKRNANGIEIRHRVQQFGTVLLGGVVLVKGFGQ